MFILQNSENGTHLFTSCFSIKSIYICLSKQLVFVKRFISNILLFTSVFFLVAWSKVNKFNCTCCGRDWGITSRSADVVIPVVKIVNFNIIDENGNSKFYDKWVKVPIQFQRSNRYRESTYMTEVC